MRRKKANKKSGLKLLKRGFVSFGSTALASLSVYEGVSALSEGKTTFFDSIPILERFLAWFFISLTITLITLVITEWQIIRDKEDENTKLIEENSLLNNKLDTALNSYDEYQKNHSDSICQLLNDAYNSQRYQEVINIGMQLSGPLWYSGKYELRAKVGEIVENAASKKGDKSTLAKVLIEMVGWTNIRLGKEQLGIEKIEEGLLVAKDISDHFLIAAAYRNLADIHLGRATSNHNLRYSTTVITIPVPVIKQREEFEECHKCLQSANDCLESIQDIKQKNEMAGNLYYTFSKYYFETGDYNLALEYVEKSMEYYGYNGNIEKQIKLYNLKGEILLMIPNKQALAVNVFRTGIQVALQHNVNVHIVSNALSLSEYFLSKGQIEQAKRSFRDAKEYSSAITDPILVEKINTLEKRLGDV